MIAWVRRPTCLCAVALSLGLGATAGSAQTSDLVSRSSLRVCADPANAPMSARDGSGYENKLAEFVAAKLELPLKYEWYPMSTGFIRNSLRANKCDLVIGYAQGHEMVLNTNHYLTSTYTLVVPIGSAIADVDTLSDSRLKGLRLGVVAGSPPATHLARNGLIGKARAYNQVVDRRHESPISDMMNDLDAGDIDAALLWARLRDHWSRPTTPDSRSRHCSRKPCLRGCSSGSRWACALVKRSGNAS